MEKAVVLNVKPIEGKKQLRAFADVCIDGELTICGVRLMEDPKGYWIGYPQNTYQTNGQTRYSPYVETSERLKSLIRKAVIEEYKSQPI